MGTNERANAYPAFLRTGVAPSKLKSGDAGGVDGFRQGDEEFSLYLVNSDEELTETIAALEARKEQYNKEVRCALLPVAVVQGAGTLQRTPEHAPPELPAAIRDRHHDWSPDNLEAALGCCREEDDRPGWTDRVKDAEFGKHWNAWHTDGTADPAFKEGAARHHARYKERTGG